MFKSLISSNSPNSIRDTVLCNFVGYFDAVMYKFERKNDQLNSVVLRENPRLKPLILVVGRGFYHEHHKSYPIDKVNEIKKLIKLEFEGRRFHFKVIKTENGKSLVNVWVFKTEVPTAFITIPESYLYAQVSGESSNIVVVDGNSKQYITSQNNVLHSQISNSLIDNPASFAMSVGMPSNFKTTKISSDEKPLVLLSAFSKRNVQKLLPFFALPKIALSGKKIKTLLIPSTCLAMLYLLLSSLFVVSYQWQLIAEIETKNSEVDSIFDMNTELETKQQKYNAIVRFMQSKTNIVGVWYALPEVIKVAEINRFSYLAGRFELTGKTEKATEVLKTLSDSDFVKDAKFKQPTRTSRGSEYFSISFAVNPAFKGKLNSQGESDETGD